jgi:hypothetical protein
LNARFEELGWALFLIFTGTLWLLPEASVPQGMWICGGGLILLGLNYARYASGMRISVFTTVLGVLAAAGGIALMEGVALPLLALCPILLGVGLILRPLLIRRGEP